MRERKTRPPLYGERRHPYYVVSPPYDRRSSGVRVMHQLCHSLNVLGEEAWMSASDVSPHLRTPLLSQEVRLMHERAGLTPIAIYPEIVGSNPLDCDVVVRYILNRPGLFGEQPNYQANDMFWLHNGELLDLVTQAEGVLHMPACDTSIWHNRDNPHDDQREGACIYFGRYEAIAREKYPELAERCTVITKTYPATHEEMADLFRRSTHVYCFENTSISMEARLCGCPIVQLPSPYCDLDNLFGASLGLNDGLVRDDDPATLEAARATLPGLADYYRTVETNYWRELERLIAKTQQRAREARHEERGPRHTAQQASYALWRSRRTLQEIDGQLHAERMLSNWRFRPRFAIGLTLSEGEGELLANSIDSMARQWYPDWQLVVFAPGIDAPPELAGIDQVIWIADEDQVAGFAQMSQRATADFYALFPVGTMLEDHALQAIADEINASPSWLALYTDHDETRADQAGADPQFKPDFNPELLYSQNYVGRSAFICREALSAFADGGESRTGNPYGLLLRIFEQTGFETIGHIADPLIHFPALDHDDAAEKLALEAHFARRGVTARIEDGWFEHTRRVHFAPADGATVSIVMMTHSEPGYLSCSLETLLETAGAPITEIILVAHRITDPDLDDYLQAAANGALGVPVTLIREDGEFRPAAFRNRAAAQAQGKYLLFADDDTEYFHENWLARLLGHAGACHLAAVAPRLVSGTDGAPRIVGGGYLLGSSGLAASLAKDSPPLLDTGSNLRLQLDQGISALPGNCLLVDRQAFEAVGGFDEAHTPSVLHDLDLSIRLGAAGGRLAWLATVDVAHQDSITLKGINRDPSRHLAWIAQQEVEKRYLIEAHLPRLVNDPNYNRNLSLRAPFAIDVEAVADWNPRFHDRPRLLGAPLTTGAGQYRVVAPFKALAKAGLAQTTVVHPVADNVLRHLNPIEIARLAPDTLLLQNCVDDNLIEVLAQSARTNPSILHVTSIDDRLGDLPRDNPLYPIHRRHARSRMRKGLSYCDRLIVTTEELRAYCADLIEDIRVVPNRLERDAWGELTGAPNTGKKPRVGWVGAMQHSGDLRLIEPVVRALADEVEWVFMGLCPDFLRPFVKESHPFVSISEYPQHMASLALDLALAPLEIHPFNECKSNLRLLEYGALAWPVICTDIAPYRTGNPPVTRLPNDPDQWIAAIRERLADRASLEREGTLLRQWVHANYILEDGLDDWLAALTR